MAKDVYFKTSGSTKNTEDFLNKILRGSSLENVLKNQADAGVRALTAATPSDTGATAASWGYEIVKEKGGYTLYFTNSNKANGNIPVAILIQYGHGTGTGGYVQGRDFINPALKPIFDDIAQKAWREVTNR